MVKAKQSIDRAAGINRQLEAALDASQEALKTANQKVVPGLVAANQTFRDAWDAQSSMSAMQVGAGSAEKDE